VRAAVSGGAWLHSVEEGLKKMGFSNWTRKLEDRDEWRAIVKGGQSSSWTVVPAEEEDEEEENDDDEKEGGGGGVG
jgi:hypothetical protein